MKTTFLCNAGENPDFLEWSPKLKCETSSNPIHNEICSMNKDLEIYSTTKHHERETIYA
jgi:hypothetical protein